MRKFLPLTFWVLLLTSCNHHIKIDKSEFKQIYSDILTADSLTRKCYLIDSVENFDKKTITQFDTTYFIADCGNIKSGVWTNNLYDSLIIISGDKLHSISRPDPFTKTPTHYSFSLPYFSKDKQSFVIYYNYYCGNLCAEYSLRLYRKINGKWTFIKIYFSTVS